MTLKKMIQNSFNSIDVTEVKTSMKMDHHYVVITLEFPFSRCTNILLCPATS